MQATHKNMLTVTLLIATAALGKRLIKGWTKA